MISLKQILNKVFPSASVVVIRGDWKTGKTDFALFLVEMMLNFNMIHSFASNIYLDPETIKKEKIPYKFICSVPSVKRWGIPPTGTSRSKAFIYDEAVSSSPSRRAMSKLNTEWLKLIPELSKGRMKLIICVHATKYMDSVFLNKTYLRGVFHKSAIKHGEKIVESYSKLIYPKMLDRETRLYRYPVMKCPRTKFLFDAYRTAVMNSETDSTFDFNERLKILYEWAYQGKSFHKIARERKLYPMQVRREFERALKSVLEDKIPEQFLKGQGVPQ